MLNETSLNSEVQLDEYSSAGNVNDNIRSVITEQVALEMEKYKEHNKEEERKKKESQKNQEQKGGACGGILFFFWFLLIGGTALWVWFPTNPTDEFPEHLTIILCVFGSLSIVSCCYSIRSCFKCMK